MIYIYFIDLVWCGVVVVVVFGVVVVELEVAAAAAAAVGIYLYFSRCDNAMYAIIVTCFN